MKPSEALEHKHDEIKRVVTHHELTNALVTANRNIPWNNMKGMRNRIAHGYFQINLDIIWDTIEKDLPNLVKEIGVVKAGLK